MLAPALIAVIAIAGGCSSSVPQSGPENTSMAEPAAASDEAGLPTKGDDDSGLGTKGDDGGLGTKGDDGGLGTKGDDGGLGTNDDGGTGTGEEDAGTGGGGGKDAGGMTASDAGGGGLGACFACAEQRGCEVPVNACVHSQACMAEGSCDLACLTAPGAHLTGPDPRCVASCSTDFRATGELRAAVTCGFRVCPIECLHPLISCGGDAGSMQPVDPGCLGHPGALPF